MTAARHRWQFDALCIAMAAIGGVIAGAVDFRNDEPQAAVIVILAFAGALGFLRPKRAWLWAIIVGLGVPLVYLIASALGYQSRSVPEPGWYASLIALIPALISAYSGVLVRKIMIQED
jgi:NhaP-type Na+/H+ or K+/H+ antiporter